MAKNINEDDLRSIFIPVEELGMDPSQFTVDPEYWFNEMYELYKDSCHSENPLDESQSFETHIDPDKIDQHSFSAFGRVGFFRWYALTLYYDESIHVMDDVKMKHNENHEMTVCDEFLADPGENISNAINNNDDLVNILERNPIVANTEECVEFWDSAHGCQSKEYSHIRDLAQRLSVFLGQGFALSKILKSEGGNLIIDPNLIKGKDVVLPFIWANKEKLKLFGELAKRCIDNGANTVVGIFASRQVPSMDGREASQIPSEFEPGSFGPRFYFSPV